MKLFALSQTSVECWQPTHTQNTATRAEALGCSFELEVGRMESPLFEFQAKCGVQTKELAGERARETEREFWVTVSRQNTSKFQLELQLWWR